MSKFKIGDRVVTHKFKSDGIFFDLEMEQFIGLEGEIELIYANGGYCVHGWSWPEYSLTVKKGPTVKFTPMPELKTGNRVVLAHGDTYIVFKGMQFEDRIFGKDAFMNLKSYDLRTGKCKDAGSEGWSISKVYKGDTEGHSDFLDLNFLGEYSFPDKPIWEYKEPEIIKTEADLLREQLDDLKAKLRELGEEE